MASTDERTLMLNDESDYDIRCQQLRQDNAALLDDFSRWLKKAGLGAATIRSHCTNLDFYLNHFLLYADTLTPTDGVCYVGEFLGDWFIHKATITSALIIVSIGMPGSLLRSLLTAINPDDAPPKRGQRLPEWGLGLRHPRQCQRGGSTGPQPQPRQQGRLALLMQRQAEETGKLALLNIWITTALDLGVSEQNPPRQESFGAEAWLLNPEENRLLLLVLA